MSEKENVVMKKFLRIITVLMLILGLSVTAMAAELSGCRISADSVSSRAGEQITVPIRITQNPGFTNFGIALDYDREKLTLVGIQLSENEETAYLCGEFAVSGLKWNPGKDINAEQNDAFAVDNLYGYVVCVQSVAVKTDGILFTATFRLADDFEGTAAVTPIVNYMRNNEAVFSVFETVTVQPEQGVVSAKQELMIGDVNGDGIVNAGEMVKIIQGYRGKTVDESVILAVDVNGNGIIDASELIRAVRNYRGG
jgi:hypothetical protein